MDRFEHGSLKRVEKIRSLLDQHRAKHRSTDLVTKQTYDYLKEKLTSDAGQWLLESINMNVYINIHSCLGYLDSIVPTFCDQRNVTDVLLLLLVMMLLLPQRRTLIFTCEAPSSNRQRQQLLRPGPRPPSEDLRHEDQDRPAAEHPARPEAARRGPGGGDAEAGGAGPQALFLASAEVLKPITKQEALTLPGGHRHQAPILQRFLPKLQHLRGGPRELRGAGETGESTNTMRHPRGFYLYNQII